MDQCPTWAIQLPSPPLGAPPGPEMGLVCFSHPEAAPLTGLCNHHAVTDSALPSPPSPFFLEIIHVSSPSPCRPRGRDLEAPFSKISWGG